MRKFFDNAALRLLCNECEKDLEELTKKQFNLPLSQLTSMGDEPEDIAYAANMEGIQVPIPEMQELVDMSRVALGKLFPVKGKHGASVTEMVTTSSVRCFFECSLGVKDLVLARGTTINDARPAVGWLWDQGRGEHLDFGIISEDHVLQDGERIPFSINAQKIFPTPPAHPEVPSTRVNVPIGDPRGSGPRPDRPDHVVVLMLENRSFDHMFGKISLPAGHPGFHRRTDLPDAVPVLWPDPDHDVPGVQGVQLGHADGHEGSECGFCQQRLKASNFEESYRIQSEKEYSKKAPSTGGTPASSFKEEQIQCMAHLAKEFCTSDEWYAGLSGPTVPNRMLFLTCATPFNSHHNPEGGSELLAYVKGMKTVPTLFERLEECRVVRETGVEPWRVYYEDTPLSIFLSHLKPTQHSNFRKMERFKEDVEHNRLPLFSFIEPRYYDRPGEKKFANDFHPPHNAMLADELVQFIYETIAANPQVAQKTLFMITFDEHGGTYDHVIPPMLTHARTPELAHLGFRVPAIFVSPHVPKQSVLRRDGVHTQSKVFPSNIRLDSGRVLSHGSLSATFHDWFGTEYLNERDAGSATFCSVWQPQGPGALPALPFKVNCPRLPDGRPTFWSPYPDTGIYLYAECLVADFYLAGVRPTLHSVTDDNGVDQTYVDTFVRTTHLNIQGILQNPQVDPVLKPFLEVALNCFAFLANVTQEQNVSKIYTEGGGGSSFWSKLKTAIPQRNDFGKLLPPRVILLFVMRALYLPLIWINRLYRPKPPQEPITDVLTCQVSSVPRTAAEKAPAAPAPVAVPVVSGMTLQQNEHHNIVHDAKAVGSSLLKKAGGLFGKH